MASSEGRKQEEQCSKIIQDESTVDGKTGVVRRSSLAEPSAGNEEERCRHSA
jgi:hypothetical protein